jgi:hypothetical protein
MRKEQCPWGYQYKGRARSVNRKHRCNVSCWERWTLMRCLQWARETAIHWGPGPGDAKSSRRVTHASLEPSWKTT